MFELIDILGDVRGNGYYYSLKNFIQPNEPLIQELAFILYNSDEGFIELSQDFVHRIVKYETQSGEFWRYPTETISTGRADCDDTSILLCSILRNYIPAEDVYVAVGSHNSSGHAWVVAGGKIIESTASSKHKIDLNKYHPEVLFNDKYAYSEHDSFGFVTIKQRYQFRVTR